jgi:uncharacterized protein (TIGR02145 family)
MNNMKNMTKTALLLAMLATGNRATAQTEQLLEAGQAYTFTNTTAASGTGGSVSYQWYRNGIAINGATSATYSLPNYLAYGYRVEFKRAATSPGCDGWSFSNFYVLTFHLTVGGVKWMTTNVRDNKTCAERPDEYTEFFQWNNGESGSTWTSANNPCPTSPSSWRLPTQSELQALVNAGTGTWADANTKGNAVAGRFVGSGHASCNLASNMASCLFLPAPGYKLPQTSGGSTVGTGTFGIYWSRTQNSSNTNNAYSLTVNSSSSSVGDSNKGGGMNVRCVQ